jgi:hypothetical protein
MIKGLYIERANKIAAATAYPKNPLIPDRDPRDAHEREMSARTARTQADDLKIMIEETESFIERIEELIDHLANHPSKSAHRTLAQRDLENASMRLRRELGDKPI